MGPGVLLDIYTLTQSDALAEMLHAKDGLQQGRSMRLILHHTPIAVRTQR